MCCLCKCWIIFYVKSHSVMARTAEIFRNEFRDQSTEGNSANTLWCFELCERQQQASWSDVSPNYLTKQDLRVQPSQLHPAWFWLKPMNLGGAWGSYCIRFSWNLIPLAAEQINTNQNGDHSLCRRGCSMDNSPEMRNLAEPARGRFQSLFFSSVRLTSCLHRQLSASIQAK